MILQIVCGLLYLQILPIFCSEKVLINIDNIVREFDATTSCDISAWANELSNACKCCLFKRVPQMGSGPGQKTAEAVVAECINEEYCTQELINSLQTSTESTDLKTALYQLYNTSIVIKKMSKDRITFDAQGNLTEQGAKTLLEKAFKEGKLFDQNFKSVTCIKIQDISAEKKGLHTLQLFLINSNCLKPQSYILKEMADKYTETRKLANFFGLKQLDDIIWPRYSKDYPALAIPFAFLQYNNHYLSLALKAEGVELEKFVVNYFLNPSPENKQKVKQAYFDVGYVLSKFHQRFMKNKNDILGLTVVHGDLHHRNIFYDTTTRRVILIDNELMPDSFEKPQSPMRDIAYLIFSPNHPSLIPKSIATKVKAGSWIQLIIAPFLKGYISAYSKKDWPLLFNKLAAGIKEYKGPFAWYNKFKEITDKQLQIVKEYTQTGQSIQNNQEKLKDSLIKLQHSLSKLVTFINR